MKQIEEWSAENVPAEKVQPTDELCRSKYTEHRAVLVDGRLAAWSGNEIPKIGETIQSAYVSDGPMRVTGYVVDCGYLGLVTENQWGDSGVVFGAEVAP